VIDDPLAVAGRDVVAARVVRNFDDFPEELVRLLLARACVTVFPELAGNFSSMSPRGFEGSPSASLNVLPFVT
jgi:hypothetical protein